MTALLAELTVSCISRLPADHAAGFARGIEAQQSLLKMQSLMPRFQTSVDALVHERQSLHALYEVGQSVNSTLELAEVLTRSWIASFN